MSSERQPVESRMAACRSSGCLVMVVGPSGAGKDTVIRLALAAFDDDPRVRAARRVVTRPAGPHEDHDSVAPAAFEASAERGEFALHWRAHGLAYGITPEEADCRKAVVLANVSRTAIAAGRAWANDARVVLVTAPPELLAARIAARGRDPADGSRTDRQHLDTVAAAEADLVIVNDGDAADAARALADLIRGLLDRFPAA